MYKKIASLICATLTTSALAGFRISYKGKYFYIPCAEVQKDSLYQISVNGTNYMISLVNLYKLCAGKSVSRSGEDNQLRLIQTHDDETCYFYTSTSERR